MLAPADVAGRNLESSNAEVSTIDRGDDVKESWDGDEIGCKSLDSGTRRTAPAGLGKALDAEFVDVDDGRDILVAVEVELLAE